jgi:hypothetical protein
MPDEEAEKAEHVEDSSEEETEEECGVVYLERYNRLTYLESLCL